MAGSFLVCGAPRPEGWTARRCKMHVSWPRVGVIRTGCRYLKEVGDPILERGGKLRANFPINLREEGEFVPENRTATALLKSRPCPCYAQFMCLAFQSNPCCGV
jgi:hypothetical protein